MRAATIAAAKMLSDTPIAAALVGPGTVGKALLEQLRVEVSVAAWFQVQCPNRSRTRRASARAEQRDDSRCAVLLLPLPPHPPQAPNLLSKFRIDLKVLGITNSR